MSGHRHETDRKEGTIVAECPNIDDAPDDHLAIVVEYETAVDDEILDDLTDTWETCGECGAELDVVDMSEPVEVME